MHAAHRLPPTTSSPFIVGVDSDSLFLSPQSGHSEHGSGGLVDLFPAATSPIKGIKKEEEGYIYSPYKDYYNPTSHIDYYTDEEDDWTLFPEVVHHPHSRMNETLSRPPSPLSQKKTSPTSFRNSNTILASQDDFSLAGDSGTVNPVASTSGTSSNKYSESSACSYDLRDHTEPPTVKQEYPPEDNSDGNSRATQERIGEDNLDRQLDAESGPVCFPPASPPLNSPTRTTTAGQEIATASAHRVARLASHDTTSDRVKTEPSTLKPVSSRSNASNTSYFDEHLPGQGEEGSKRPHRSGQPSFLKNTGDGLIRTPGPAQTLLPEEAFGDYSDITGKPSLSPVDEGADKRVEKGSSGMLGQPSIPQQHKQQTNMQMKDQKPQGPQPLPPMPTAHQAGLRGQQNITQQQSSPAYAQFAGFNSPALSMSATRSNDIAVPGSQMQSPSQAQQQSQQSQQQSQQGTSGAGGPGPLNYQSAPAPLGFHDGSFFSHQAILASLAAEENAKAAAAAAAAMGQSQHANNANNHNAHAHAFAQHFPPQHQQQQYQAQQHAAAQLAAHQQQQHAGVGGVQPPQMNQFSQYAQAPGGPYGNLMSAADVAQHYAHNANLSSGGGAESSMNALGGMDGNGSARKRARGKGSVSSTGAGVPNPPRRSNSGGAGNGKGGRSIRTTTGDDTSDGDDGVFGFGGGADQSATGRPIRESRKKSAEQAQAHFAQQRQLIQQYYQNQAAQEQAAAAQASAMGNASLGILNNGGLHLNNGMLTGGPDIGVGNHLSSEAAAAAAAAAALSGERVPQQNIEDHIEALRDDDSGSDEDEDEWVADDSDDSFGKPARKKHRRAIPNSNAQQSAGTPVGPSSSAQLAGLGGNSAKSGRNSLGGPATPGAVALDAEGNPLPEASSSASRPRQAPAGSGTIECDYVDPKTGIRCPTKFRRPYDQARHMETVHNSTGEKAKWSCATCRKTFSRKDALIRHGRISAHVTM